MSDTRKFFRENKPQIADGDKFMSDLERQLNQLPDRHEQERLLRLMRKSERLALVSAVSSILISFVLCLGLFIVIRSLGIFQNTVVFAIPAVIFCSLTLIPLYKLDIL